MNPLMLLAMFGRKLELQTVTFNSNTTWVAPAGVTNLATVSGKGTDGSPSYVDTNSADAVIVSYGGTGYGTFGNYGWTDANSVLMAAYGQISGHFSGSFTQAAISQGTDNSYDVTYSPVSFSGADTGGYDTFGGWQSSGNIADSGTGTVYWYTNNPGTPGTAATGFGKTFPGGAANTAASVTTYTNVAITPGASYSVVVPSGATVQITYYQ